MYASQTLPPPTAPRQDLLSAQLADASRREVALRQELAAAHERHATDVYRLRSRHKEAEFALQEARRRVTALQLSSKGITLDQAETLLQGEEVGRGSSFGVCWGGDG